MSHSIKINNIIITFQVAYKIGADFKLQKNDFGGYLAHDNYHEKTILWCDMNELGYFLNSIEITNYGKVNY